jgi:ABC-type dipeptide/oligopeptide/nickel transport system ATPase component
MTTVTVDNRKATAVRRTDDPVLSVDNLAIEMRSRLGVGHAVSGVTFSVQRGETLGLVGESGSGKSLTASAILQLLPKPIATIASGSIEFNGSDLLTKSQSDMRKIRGRHISMVLQDPLSALNPVMTIGSQLRESILERRHSRANSPLGRWREDKAHCAPHSPRATVEQRAAAQSWRSYTNGILGARFSGAQSLGSRPKQSVCRT